MRSERRVADGRRRPPGRSSDVVHRLAGPAGPSSATSPANASGVQSQSGTATTQARGGAPPGTRAIPSACTPSSTGNDTATAVHSSVAASSTRWPGASRRNTPASSTRSSTTPSIVRSRVRAAARKASRPAASASAPSQVDRLAAFSATVRSRRNRSIPATITSSSGAGRSSGAVPGSGSPWATPEPYSTTPMSSASPGAA